MDIKTKVGLGFIGVWLVSAVTSIAVTVGIVYVAIHFIHKLW